MIIRLRRVCVLLSLPVTNWHFLGLLSDAAGVPVTLAVLAAVILATLPSPPSSDRPSREPPPLSAVIRMGIELRGSQALYPAELRARPIGKLSYYKGNPP